MPSCEVVVLHDVIGLSEVLKVMAKGHHRVLSVEHVQLKETLLDVATSHIATYIFSLVCSFVIIVFQDVFLLYEAIFVNHDLVPLQVHPVIVHILVAIVLVAGQRTHLRLFLLVRIMDKVSC